MYDQEKIKPYGEGEKASQVEQMFDNIAPTYDKLNHRLSWDIDKGWRRKAIKALAPFKPQSLLDIATGTGDFAILATQMLQPTRVVGADISEGMMEIGRQKVKALGLDSIVTFEKEDCLHLSYNSDTFEHSASVTLPTSMPVFAKCIACLSPVAISASSNLPHLLSSP